MNSLGYLVRYLFYFLSAKTKHDIHSPFVFEFVIEVLKKKNSLTINTELQEHPLNHISSLTKKNGSLVYRIIEKYNCQNILELSHFAGSNSLYLGIRNQQKKLISIGNKNMISHQSTLLNIKNHDVIIGKINDLLIPTLKELKLIDLAFIDGNHSTESTLNIFNQCLEFCHKDSIIIFDKISHSKEKIATWQQICKHKKVTLSINLFSLGIVFFRDGRQKEHYSIRF